MTDHAKGSIQEFDESWKGRAESSYLHWVRGQPQNQVQLAFRQHWETFRGLLGELRGSEDVEGLDVLEVGAGRGTISMYFADAGARSVLLDSSFEAMRLAERLFAENDMQSRGLAGDALALPFPEASFDVVVSMGLLEHFEELDTVLWEQVRILRPGGVFLAYVVPEYRDHVQNEYEWVNDLIRAYLRTTPEQVEKPELFRSDYPSGPYKKSLEEGGLTRVGASGVYPLPMISPSPDFPFTLNPPEVEQVLVEHFERVLAKRAQETGRPGWFCEEGYGQAFFLWGVKG